MSDFQETKVFHEDPLPRERLLCQVSFLLAVLGRSLPKPSRENGDETIHGFFIGNAQMLVTMHEFFDDKISDQVEIDHGHHQSWVLAAPSRLFFYLIHDWA